MTINQEWIIKLAAALRIEPADLFRAPYSNGTAILADPTVKGIAEKAAALSPEQREVASRLLDALKGPGTNNNNNKPQPGLPGLPHPKSNG